MFFLLHVTIPDMLSRCPLIATKKLLRLDEVAVEDLGKTILSERGYGGSVNISTDGRYGSETTFSNCFCIIT